MKRFTVEPGREILYRGQPFIRIVKEGSTPPTEADEITHLIARLLEDAVKSLSYDKKIRGGK